MTELRDPALAVESPELVALAQEAGKFGLLEWRVQAGTLLLSPQCRALYDLAEFDGRPETWLRRLHREDVVRITDLVDSTFAAKLGQIQAEFRIVIPRDGTLKWIEARALIFYDAEGRATRVAGVNVDITERKRSALQLRAFAETLEDRVRERTRELEAQNAAREKAEESLRQAQKMEAVGQLTGGVAHDFNNLLTLVLGGLDVIGRQLPALGDTQAAARIARARDMALHGVQRAVTLTQRLLAFSRQQPLEPRPIDANRLVAGISELLRRTLGETVPVETVLAGGLWRAHADANQLENALLNLAVNARDAMPDGGKVTIETANCSLDETYVAALAEPVDAGQYVMIAVADSGTGMTPQAVERAFEPFFTTKSLGRGTGLGLSQVYGFVRQSAGHVRIYTELGEGTTVKLYLPRYIGDQLEIESPERPGDTLRAVGAETVLVVEDDETLRTYDVEILSELGYRVLAAADVGAALAILEGPDLIDLLFTDVVMPGGRNGRQLADEAQRLRPALKVLFTTGYTRNAIVHHGRLDPGVQMIGKPFSFQELAARVRTVLDMG